MNYTAAEMLLFIAAIGAIITQSIIAFKTGKVADHTNKIVDQTLLKAAVIEGHVNSKETKYVEQITALTRENEILRSVILDKDRVAALLAQSAIMRNPVPVVNAPETTVLKSIEKNTEETATNTQVLKTRSDKEGKR